MHTYSAVILDADGVVNDGELFSLESFGIPSERLQPFFQEKFPDCLIGKADLREELKSYLEQWGWTGTLDELLNYWFESGNTIHTEIWEVAKTLKEHDIPLYLATNQEKHRVEYMKKTMGYGDLFTDMFASCRLGTTKPKPEFFEQVIQKIGTQEPSTLLFWDDQEKNIHGAQEVGITAHLFTNQKEFAQQMKEYFPKILT